MLLVLLLVFGPKRLPEMGRSLGRGMREFKDSISGVESAFDLEQENEETKAALAQDSPALAQDSPVVTPEATPVAATPQHAEPPPVSVTVPVKQAPSGTEQSS